MEFLQANWLWLLISIGVVWFLFRRGGHGMGCGMGGHSHGSEEKQDPAHAGHQVGGQPKSTQETTRRRGGCC